MAHPHALAHKAFVAAKAYLSHEFPCSTGLKRTHLCNAIHVAAANSFCTQEEATSAQELIFDRLGGLHSFSMWLHRNHPGLSVEIDRDRTYNQGRKLQATRLAWLESLIQETAPVTDDQKLHVHKAFVAAREFLSEAMCKGGHSPHQAAFLCRAIDLAADHGKCSRRGAEGATELIASRLSPCTTLREWLQLHHPELTFALYEDATGNSSRKLQTTRRAWLEALIKEFSE